MSDPGRFFGRLTRLALTLLAFGAALGCARVTPEGGTGGNGSGSGTGGAGADPGTVDAARPDRVSSTVDAVVSGAFDGSAICQRELAAVVRDFRSGEKDGQPRHPDFEQNTIAIDPGIVATMLGPDSKPVYAGGTKGTTTTKENFDQWYRDVDGINIRFAKTIPLTPDQARPDVFVYDNDTFYPLANDEGWGNQYLDHNQDFTTELHFTFPYRGGERFTFHGDDDVFIFVENTLVVDLGGVHDPLTGTVVMDDWAPKLGLQIGQSYPMHVFQAERHCCNSRFHIETTLSCIVNIDIQ